MNNNINSNKYNSITEMLEYFDEEDNIERKNYPFKWVLKKIYLKIRNIYDYLETKYYNLKYGINNIFNWFPVIWSDRNWDYFYFYKIVYKKLCGMEKNIRLYGHHVNSDKDAKNIAVCKEHLKRLIDEPYYNNKRFIELECCSKKKKKYINYEILNSLKCKYKNNKKICDRIYNIERSPQYIYIDEQEKYFYNNFLKSLRKVNEWWD